MLAIKCPEHFAAVVAFAATIGAVDQLVDKLTYLASYGGDSAAVRCTLHKDFAPHSFGFSLEKPDLDFLTKSNGGLPAADPKWKHWFSGGLIYQGPDSPADGSFPSLTVSLAEGVGWFVHT